MKKDKFKVNTQKWPWTKKVNPEIYNERDNWPKISIVTPSYNQGQFIEETILSVINQNYPNLEYIIIDGGSTDNTINIIKKHESNIDYWISEPDNGQSDAINKGLDIASGTIVNWLNSDDFLCEKALYHVGRNYQEGINIICGTCNEVNLDYDVINQKKITNLNLGFLLSIRHLPQPSAFFSKIIFIKVNKLDATLEYAMDFDFYLRAYLEDSESIRFIPKLLSVSRFYDETKTNTGGELLLEERLKVLNKLYRKRKLSSLNYYYGRINVLKKDYELLDERPFLKGLLAFIKGLEIVYSNLVKRIKCWLM